MWLEHHKLTEINQAMSRGEAGGLRRLFSELFHPENQTRQLPAACPKCQKPLARKMHPYLESFVHACPDRHGAWISPEVSEKFQEFIKEQMLLAARRARSIRFLIGFLLSAIFLAGFSRGEQVFQYFFSGYQDLKISENHWPRRNFLKLENLDEGKIQDPQERGYLIQVMDLLEFGASNRLNLEAVLKTRRSQERTWGGFEVYQKNHKQLMAKMQMLSIPQTLQPFHEHLLRASENQRIFYAAFMEAKAENPGLRLKQMLNHPNLRACNRELLNAYDILLKRYPGLDIQTHHAIESRLCWFDIV